MAALISCGTTKFVIDGREVEPNSASRILRSLADSFTGNYTPIIQAIDDHPPNIIIKPAKHRFTISYVKIENYMALSTISTKTFKGIYDITITTKAGKLYAPVFKRNSGTQGPQLEQICLVEIDQQKDGVVILSDIDKIREKRDEEVYSKCAQSSIPPDSEFVDCTTGVGVSAYRSPSCK